LLDPDRVTGKASTSADTAGQAARDDQENDTQKEKCKEGTNREAACLTSGSVAVAV